MAEVPSDPLVAYLRDHAHSYFDALRAGETRVELLRTLDHRRSCIYLFQVTGDNFQRGILAKVAKRSSFGPEAHNLEAVANPDRPRLVPQVELATVRPEIQYRSLSLVHEHFDRLADPRFGAVRPLDYLPSLNAIVMEVVHESTLRRLLWKATRPVAPFTNANLEKAFRNVGAWLRTFHHLPDSNTLPPLRARREEVIEALEQYADFLTHRVGHDRFLRAAVATAAAHASQALPDPLPLGMGHGDFAPRNVLVGANCRVTVIDMLCKLRVPIYEDLMYFANELRAARMQKLAYGIALSSASLDRYEHELLTGYFEPEPPPRRAMAFFRLLIVLDKWSALVEREDRLRRGRHALRVANRALRDRNFRSETWRAVKAIRKP
jgi:hypothetical protein